MKTGEIITIALGILFGRTIVKYYPISSLGFWIAIIIATLLFALITFIILRKKNGINRNG